MKAFTLDDIKIHVRSNPNKKRARGKGKTKAIFFKEIKIIEMGENRWKK